MVKEGTREGMKRPEHCSPRESLASSKESKPDSILFDTRRKLICGFAVQDDNSLVPTSGS